MGFGPQTRRLERTLAATGAGQCCSLFWVLQVVVAAQQLSHGGLQVPKSTTCRSWEINTMVESGGWKPGPLLSSPT